MRYVARPRPPRYETAVAAHEARRAAQSPEERADGDRIFAALEALIEPATPPPGIARAAAVFAGTPDLALPPDAPAYLVLAALAQLLDTVTDEAELALLAPPGADA